MLGKFITKTFNKLSDFSSTVSSVNSLYVLNKDKSQKEVNYD